MHPDGKHVTVGTRSGFLMLELDGLKVVSQPTGELVLPFFDFLLQSFNFVLSLRHSGSARSVIHFFQIV